MDSLRSFRFSQVLATAGALEPHAFRTRMRELKALALLPALHCLTDDAAANAGQDGRALGYDACVELRDLERVGFRGLRAAA